MFNSQENSVPSSTLDSTTQSATQENSVPSGTFDSNGLAPQENSVRLMSNTYQNILEDHLFYGLDQNASFNSASSSDAFSLGMIDGSLETMIKRAVKEAITDTVKETIQDAINKALSNHGDLAGVASTSRKYIIIIKKDISIVYLICTYQFLYRSKQKK